MFFLKYFGCSLRRNSKWSFVGIDSLGFLVQVHSLYQYIEVMSLRNSDSFRNWCVIYCMRSSLYITFFLLSLHYYGSKKCLLLRGCYLTILCNTFPRLLRLTLEYSNPPPLKFPNSCHSDPLDWRLCSKSIIPWKEYTSTTPFSHNLYFYSPIKGKLRFIVFPFSIFIQI